MHKIFLAFLSERCFSEGCAFVSGFGERRGSANTHRLEVLHLAPSGAIFDVYIFHLFWKDYLIIAAKKRRVVS